MAEEEEEKEEEEEEARLPLSHARVSIARLFRRKMRVFPLALSARQISRLGSTRGFRGFRV